MHLSFASRTSPPMRSQRADTLRQLSVKTTCRLVLAFLLTLCLLVEARAEVANLARTPSGDPTPIPAVRLLEVDAQRLWRTRSFFGRISARETVSLSFEVGGRLVDFSLREGSRLAQGEAVARLEADSFERAVRRADLDLKQALRELSRAKKLARSGAGSAVRAEDAETAAELARVALGDAQEALQDSVLVAPFNVVVSKRLGKEFSNVVAGQPIVSLHDMSEVRVEIDVPERVFQSVTDPSRITFDGELPDGRKIELFLVEFEAETASFGQSFRAALMIQPEDAIGLYPGASMTVHAHLPIEEAGTALPSSAILSSSDRDFEVMVFVPTSAGLGVVERRRIELRAPGGTSFRALGLEEGEQIVAAGAHLLTDGQTVRRYDGLVVEEK